MCLEAIGQYKTPQLLSTCLLRQSHLHGTHSVARLAGQQVTRIFLSPSLQRWYYRCTLPHLGSLWLLVDCLVG